MTLSLRPKARLVRRLPTGTPLLLYPERALELNASAAEIVVLLDGTRSRSEIVATLAEHHPEVARWALEQGVSAVIEELTARALIEERA